ncbi:MAG: response regulator [Bacteroidales bacterium]|nr:response regulator [Bacteroidales bacterium]
MKSRSLFAGMWLVLLLWFPFRACLSQPQGKLVIQNYDLTEIGSSSGAFWTVIKDRKGVLYFGGEQAVFEFDGTSWRRIEIPNKSVVRSLAISEAGTIYVGGVSEFGYLAPDSIGCLRYVTLLDKLPPDRLNFPDVWSINVIGDAVFFQTANLLFIYRNNEIRTLEIAESYHRSFAVNGKLILNQRNKGLCQLQGDRFILMPEGEFFGEMIISSVTVYEGGRLLVGTRRNGLYLYNPSASARNRIVPFSSEASLFLKEYHLYHGIELPGNRYAFATLRNGTIIMDRQGHILNFINKYTGSSDYSSYCLFLSNDSELWITSARGISLYNIHSALNYWDEEMGLYGTVNCIAEHRDKLYAGTASGLYLMDLKEVNRKNNGYQPDLFTHLKNLDSEVWELLPFNPGGPDAPGHENELLAATAQGLYNVDRQQLEFKTDRVGQLTIFQSRINPTLIYLNAHPTFYVLQYRHGGWIPVWEKQISSYIISIVEDPDGNVWLGTMYYGIFKIGLEDLFRNPAYRLSSFLPDTAFRSISIENFNTNDGLPSLTMAKTHLYQGDLIIACEGIYTFNSKTNRMEKAEHFGEEVSLWNRTMEDFEEDLFGNVWGHQNEILDKQPDGKFQIISLPYQKMALRNAALRYLHDRSGATWIGGEYGLLRYDSRMVYPSAVSDFSTLLRRVTISGDSTIFGGAAFSGYQQDQSVVEKPPGAYTASIPYRSRSILFEYSCPYFMDDIPLEYSYFLEGYDNGWSEWSKSTFKEYSNLREKSYTFRVRAKNYAGEISREAVYPFTITPPWQRTLLAYLVYAISFITVIFFGIKLYVSRLRQSNIQLEKLVRDRTSRLEMQKEEINKQADKLKIQNEKLVHQRNRMSEMSKEILRTNREKLRFFTNISHELRTPLTLIMGPIEELADEKQSLSREETKTKYDTITKNARRLLTLVNQILDFRKLEITRPTLSASEGDIVSFINDLTGCFRELARKKDINLVFTSGEKQIVTWYDSDKIGKILFNLLSNAFKYTDNGGKIKVGVRLGRDRYPGCEGKEVVYISVSDTGIGMDEELLPKIFDRFFHSDRLVTLEQAGSGIGLSMAATLAEIHYGKIEVESELGKGSEFTLIIPYGASFLKEEEKKPSSEQNIIQAFNEKAKMEVLNHLNVSSRKKITETKKDSGKHLILIVEDSEDIRSYIINGLETRFDFIEAEDGEEGLNMALKFNPDVIISDILMPKMDGYELCSRIKSTIEISHIPVILLTSRSDDEDQRVGLEMGADAYITKPFSLKLLEARIKNLIQASVRMKERFSKDVIYKPAGIVITSTDEKFLNRALKTVEANLSNHEFGVDLFAREMAMSQSTLYRKLKALTGESTNNFIKEFRLKQAAIILQNNDVQVSEVSLMVGFDDPAYFAKSFKQKFGKSPSEFTREKK